MYNYLNYAVIFAFCIFVLTVLFVYSQKRQNIYFVGQIFFQLLLVSVAIILIADLLMWIYGSKNFANARIIHLVSSTIYFAMSTLPSMFFLLYTNARINKSSRSTKKLLPLALLPVVVNLTLTILSLWYGLIFNISASNDYSRGPFMWVMAILSYFNIAIAFFIMIINRSKISRKEIFSIVSFCIIPIICNVIQMIFYGLNLLWSGVTITCLMLYLFTLNDSIRIDQITGVYNRRQLEQYLYVVFTRKSNKRKIVGIMLDLDNFKSINDKFGHAEGDIALGKAGILLKRAFGKFFISRYAGDEFVVILETDAPALDIYYQSLKTEEEIFNKNSKLPYCLTFSMGAVSVLRGEDIDVATFIKRLDEKMYEDKRSRQLKHY